MQQCLSSQYVFSVGIFQSLEHNTEVIILFLCTVPCYLKCCTFPSCQVIVPAMGFDIVIICPAFEDICWVSDVNGVRLCMPVACMVVAIYIIIADVSHLYIILASSSLPAGELYYLSCHHHCSSLHPFLLCSPCRHIIWSVNRWGHCHWNHLWIAGPGVSHCHCGCGGGAGCDVQPP